MFLYFLNLGYQLSDISECVIWMTPFALALREAGFENPKPKSGSNYESWSNLQYHTVDLKLLVSIGQVCSFILY